MKPEVLAQARRYYHHVLHGGTLRPEDVAFMVEALEEAAHQREWVGLTKEELQHLCVNSYHTDNAGETHFNRGSFADAIEAKLKEKNA